MRAHICGIGSLSLLVSVSCVSMEERTVTMDAPLGAAEVRAAWTSDPIAVDGRLDEAVWRRAPVYALTVPTDLSPTGAACQPREPGAVRFAWDHEFLYVAFELIDAAVVQRSDEDQQYHFRTGDVVELFLKPVEEKHYWEFYATPNARKSAIFFPGPRKDQHSGQFTDANRLRVAAHVTAANSGQGCWIAEMAVPLRDLAIKGVPLQPDQPWTLLVGRYNYGSALSNLELSTFPQLAIADFHRHDSYARLLLDW